MHRSLARKLALPALALGLLALSSGCAVLQVDMTSTPDVVTSGQPVTFNLKLTNRSQCPVPNGEVEIIAFIPLDEFDLTLTSDLPSDAPPEFVTFLEQLRMFFDELCSGGTPELPDPPMFSTSCAPGEEEVVCTMEGPVAAHEGSSGGMTFATLGNRLQCEIGDESFRCQLRLPRANAPAGGGGAFVSKSLDCITPGDTGGEGSVALCVIGTFENLEGLDPGEMATGQVTLPAVGEGFVRNIAIAFAGIEGGLGVCKGGAEAGNACSDEDVNACPGSVCGEGICVGGTQDGEGCDESTELTDCPGVGADCVSCEEVPDTGFLPVDCTTTYIGPQPVPSMSTWGLVSLAMLLFVSGTLWLRRRGTPRLS